MDELNSLWNYHENMEDLKHKLLSTALELDTVKMESREQMRKNQEYIKNLLDLLNVAQKERDEARDNLQKILYKFNPIKTPTHDLQNFPHLSPDSPVLFAAKAANSSITESNSLGSPPADSLLDAAAVTSPEFSNYAVSDTSFNREALVIESLAKRRALPQKGRLLQAVMEAGPLLQTLLVAGPLPRWRNPPPLQTFRIPPVGIKGAESSPVVNLAGNSSSVYSQTCSASMLDFGGSGGGGSGGYSRTRMVAMGSGFGEQSPVGKRQRLR